MYINILSTMTLMIMFKLYTRANPPVLRTLIIAIEKHLIRRCQALATEGIYCGILFVYEIK